MFSFMSPEQHSTVDVALRVVLCLVVPIAWAVSVEVIMALWNKRKGGQS